METKLTKPQRRKGPQTREDRLKVALKANMARRKAQAIERAKGAAVDPEQSQEQKE